MTDKKSIASDGTHVMKPYFALIKEVLEDGHQIVNERTGEVCYFIPNTLLSFDLREGTPWNTRKKVGHKNVRGECLGILNGVTDAAEFEKWGTNVWYQNANETEKWLQSPWRKGENDNGLIYQYKEKDDRCIVNDEAERDFYIEQGYTVELEGKDGRFCMHRTIYQLDDLIKLLLTNKSDRRMLITAWDPTQLDKCSLPACHFSYGFKYIPGGFLDITCFMRSWDVAKAFNIQLATILLNIVCRFVNLTPRMVNVFSLDTHLYSRNLDMVNTMLERDDLPPPKLMLSDNIKEVTLENYKGAFQRIMPDDIWLEDHQSHPAIKSEMVA
ncbi:MAG: thymidylate synthase [Methylophilus sp.]|uniref:thymidylate synthase n=1 Tax=Methylophilus sp. TaxID=29541 RepID=UPI003F9FD254